MSTINSTYLTKNSFNNISNKKFSKTEILKEQLDANLFEVSNNREKITNGKNTNFLELFKRENSQSYSHVESQNSSDFNKSYSINRDVTRDDIVNSGQNSNAIIKSLLDDTTFNSNGRMSVLANGGSVSYAEDFDYNNPVIIVRGEDDFGFFEAYVNLNDIDINNCSFIEMEALNGFYLGEAMNNGTFDSTRGIVPSFNSSNIYNNNSRNPNFTFNLIEATQNYQSKVASLSNERFLESNNVLDFLNKFI